MKDPLTNLPIANELITVYYDESTELSLSSEKKHWGNGLAMVTPPFSLTVSYCLHSLILVASLCSV